MNIRMMMNYSTGGRLFRQNEIYPVQDQRYVKTGCKCKEPALHYIISISGKTYYIPDNKAAQTVTEPDEDLLPDKMIQEVGDTGFVVDFNPYRIQNDQAAVVQSANNIPM